MQKGVVKKGGWGRGLGGLGDFFGLGCYGSIFSCILGFGFKGIGKDGGG